MIGSRMWSFVAEAVWRARNRSERLAQIQRATTPFGRWPRPVNRRPMLGAVVFETRIEPATTEGACVALPLRASTIAAVRTRQTESVDVRRWHQTAEDRGSAEAEIVHQQQQ